ncbi:hypothetical protein YN1_6690 [Nanoarchaeota archaeon]
MNKNINILIIFRIFRSSIAGYITVFLPLFLYNVLKLSLIDIGILFALGSLFQSILSFFIGYLGDKYNKKKLLFYISLLFPLSLVILYFSSNIYLLIISFILGGFGTVGALAGGGVGAVVTPIMNSLITGYVNENREKIYSYFIIISGLSGSLGALLLFFYYKFVLIFGIIILLFSSLLLLKLDEPKEIIINNKEERKVEGLIILSGFLNGASAGIIYNFLPIIFNHYLDFSKDQISLIYTITGLISVISLYFIEKYINWNIFKKIVSFRIISSIFLIIFLISTIFVLSIISILSFIIYTTFRVASIPSQQEVISENIGKRLSETFGANQSTRILGSFIFQSLGGYLLSLSIIAPFLISSIFLSTSAFIYYKIRRMN